MNDSHMYSSHESINNEIETIVLRYIGFNVEKKWIHFNFYEISFRFLFLFFCIKIFYVRAPSQYMTPSGVGTIKLTYTSNQAQPQTSAQYASTTPKVNLNISLDQRVWNENEMKSDRLLCIAIGCIRNFARSISIGIGSHTTKSIRIFTGWNS